MLHFQKFKSTRMYNEVFETHLFDEVTSRSKEGSDFLSQRLASLILTQIQSQL